MHIHVHQHAIGQLEIDQMNFIDVYDAIEIV